MNQHSDSSRSNKKKQRARREQIISGVRAFSLPNGAGAEVSLEGIPTNRSDRNESANRPAFPSHLIQGGERFRTETAGHPVA